MKIPPFPGQTFCVETYSDCTAGPVHQCEGATFTLSCGETAKVPGSNDWVECDCK